MKSLLRTGWATAGAVIVAAATPVLAAADPPAGTGKHGSTAAANSPAAAEHSAAGGKGTPKSAPCPTYTLSKSFSAWHDSREYALLSGESVDNVGGQGWQLSGDAQLVTTTLADGTQGQVLDMPAGSVVVTPPMCVNASSYPEARTMVRDVQGDRGIAVSVSYQDSTGWGSQLAAGMIKDTRPGWAPSKPIMLHAGSLRGMHVVRLTLTAGKGEYQLYNFYIDPRRGR